MSEASEEPNPVHPSPARRRWMSVLARGSGDRIGLLLANCGALPNHTVLRGPEGGLVMLRGRAGGSGMAFNLGEMTATRCTVRTDSGQVGHAYVAGRDERQAELAALVDALMQDPDRAAELEAQVVSPLEQAQAAARAAQAGRAAKTKVEFFAMQTTRA